jgi:inosine-uridine nucleoside N-ribohydrolase
VPPGSPPTEGYGEVTRRFVIDTDPGIDDALALLLAARASAARLAAVSVTYGNTTLDRAARNARLVLARAPSDAPVFAGWDRPLRRALVTAKETHGAEGLGDHGDLPAPEPVTPSRRGLLDAIARAGGEITLVTLGPLTNLASALAEDAALVRRSVIRHVMMGGNVAEAGNTGPFSEFNVWCDPEAADAVFRAGLGTEMVGLDVTRRLVLPATAVATLATHSDPEARWLGHLLGFYVRFHEEYEGLRGAVINDPLAVALALTPAWGRAEPVPIAVDLGDGEDRGRTAVGGAGDPRVAVYRQVDLPAVHDLLLEHLFGRWLTKADFRP